MNMKRFNRFFLLFNLFIFICHTAFATTCPSKEALNQLAINTVLTTPRIVGLSIALSHPDCGDFNFVFGEANLANHLPMHEDTLLPIASNTKPILIAMALTLMETKKAHFPAGLHTKLTDIRDKNNQPIFTANGKVNLADGSTIDLVDADFFKIRTGESYDCKKDPVYQCPNLAEIDLHHLLLEASGLADYVRETDLSHDNVPDMLKFVLGKLHSPLKDTGSTEVESDMEALKKFGLVKKANPDPILPAQSHNTDASLLAIILERVSGLSLNELLAQTILKPLGLPLHSMQFVTHAADHHAGVARRYALLNTDEEVEKAIATNTLLLTVNKTLANQLKPSFLSTKGRQLYTTAAKTDAIDVLDLHGQGLFAFPGPGGIIAQPKAYIRFYHAFASGKLLSKEAQQLFNASFVPQVKTSDYHLATGYGSNDKTEWLTSSRPSTFLSHGGFVPGGESSVIYHYESGLTLMVATNTSGNWRNILPLLFVTPTAYLDKSGIWQMQLNYAALFKAYNKG